MNFIFEWQEQYPTSEWSIRVRYCSCHECVMFLSLYRHTDDNVFDDFRRFPTTYRRLSKTSPKVTQKLPKNFPTISEDYQLLKTFEEDRMMF